jgi:hypothetical protein
LELYGLYVEVELNFPQWQTLIHPKIWPRFLPLDCISIFIGFRDRSLFIAGVAPKRNVFLIGKILLIQSLKSQKRFLANLKYQIENK